MQISSIEPTPNPNSMKLNMNETLPPELRLSFRREDAAAAPAHLRRLLEVEGVRSVYQVADFIALERYPGADWQQVLAGVRAAFESELPDEPLLAEPPGKVIVLVQVLRSIPMQVKLLSGIEEVRVALPPRFKEIALKVAQASADFLAERKWESLGVRYGTLEEVGAEVADEIAAAYDAERLERLLAQALQQPGAETAPAEPLRPAEVAARLQDPDWRKRYAALEQLEPAPEALDVIVGALDDPNPSVRRLAAVYLGEVGGPEVMPHLYRALKDPSAAVRRAAGDCLSDIGDPAATAPMAETLQDSSKLVRWRAARFLYEVGDASALPALRAAENDPEFEIRLQVRMAIERIEGGQGAVEPAWKQLTKLWDGEGQV